MMAKTLNYKHLRYFWVVAKTGSIAKASAQLHLTPHAISGQLREFEETLGVSLLRRVGRGLETMVSSMWRATMSGFPASLHMVVILACASATFSAGMARPRAPRASMMPSAASRISSKLRRPCDRE